MVDAAGAIYVIGGLGGTTTGTDLQDVWASTDGGARPDPVQVGIGGYSCGVLEWGLEWGTKGYCGVLGGTMRVVMGFPWGY